MSLAVMRNNIRLSLSHGAAEANRPTFPQMFCAAVSQNGDEGLFISAELLLSRLEEHLRAQKQVAP